MSTIVTADLHLTDNPRDAYRHAWVSRLPALARKLKCSTAVIAGDLTEFKDNHASGLVNFIVEQVHALAKACDRVIVYKGNHDYTAENDPFFAFLSCLDGVSYYTHPAIIGDGELERCLVLPHTRNYERDWSKELIGYKYRWTFAHNTFAGADMGHGRRADGIPLKVLGSHRVISGDVHIPQKFDNLRYIGAPYTVDFGDDYDPRVLVLNGDAVTSVPCGGPQKLLVDIRMAEKLDKLDEVETVKGDIVKVRIEITNYEHDAWKVACDEVKVWAALRGVMLYQILPIKSEAPGGRVRRKPSLNVRDDGRTLDDFGRARGVDDRTMDTGHYIMEQSK